MIEHPVETLLVEFFTGGGTTCRLTCGRCGLTVTRDAEEGTSRTGLRQMALAALDERSCLEGR